MGKLNLEALKEFETQSHSGSDRPYFFMSNRDIDPDNPLRIRLLAPLDHYKMYFLLRQQYFMKVGDKWVNLVSPRTFGEDCKFSELVSEARTSGDSDVKQLFDAKASKNFDDRPKAIVPCLILEDEEWKGKNCLSYGVKEGKVCLLELTSGLVKKINKFIFSPDYQTEDELSCCSPTEGVVITISKSGTGLNTSYEVLAGRHSLDISDVVEDMDIPDIYDITRKRFMSDDYHTDLFNAYVEGDDAPNPDDYREDNPAPVAKKKVVKKKVAAPVRKKRSLLDAMEEE